MNHRLGGYRVHVLRHNKQIGVKILMDGGVFECVQPEVGHIECGGDRPHDGVDGDHEQPVKPSAKARTISMLSVREMR